MDVMRSISAFMFARHSKSRSTTGDGANGELGTESSVSDEEDGVYSEVSGEDSGNDDEDRCTPGEEEAGEAFPTGEVFPNGVYRRSLKCRLEALNGTSGMLCYLNLKMAVNNQS